MLNLDSSSLPTSILVSSCSFNIVNSQSTRSAEPTHAQPIEACTCTLSPEFRLTSPEIISEKNRALGRSQMQRFVRKISDFGCGRARLSCQSAKFLSTDVPTQWIFGSMTWLLRRVHSSLASALMFDLRTLSHCLIIQVAWRAKPRKGGGDQKGRHSCPAVC